ncbi:MAG: hypothetical protein ACR2IV_02060 [Bryobacteraceae bacterium]
MGTEQHPLIRAAEEELSSLLKAMADIDHQRADLQQKIEVVAHTLTTLKKTYGQPGNQEVFGDFIDPNLGVTEQIREILKSKFSVLLLPTVVRDYLESRGFSLNYDNPMAMVHQVLRRLETQKEAESEEMAGGGRAYRWKPPESIGGMILRPAPRSFEKFRWESYTQGDEGKEMRAIASTALVHRRRGR